ncbi:MAG TPA: type II toxin-antitoxin system RelE/ParE family toxin [Rhizomicrobium sp.]|jgi:plasmid stabilization system protein ParE
MKRILFDPQAYRHVAQIYAHIAADDPTAAGRVVERIGKTVALLADFPDMGHKLRYRPDRVMTVTPYPYFVFYRVRAMSSMSRASVTPPASVPCCRKRAANSPVKENSLDWPNQHMIRSMSCESGAA